MDVIQDQLPPTLDLHANNVQTTNVLINSWIDVYSHTANQIKSSDQIVSVKIVLLDQLQTALTDLVPILFLLALTGHVFNQVEIVDLTLVHQEVKLFKMDKVKERVYHAKVDKHQVIHTDTVLALNWHVGQMNNLTQQELDALKYLAHHSLEDS